MRTRITYVINGLLAIVLWSLLLGGAESVVFNGGFFGHISALVNNFTDLSDAFSSYAGNSLKLVRVREDESGLEAYGAPLVVDEGSNTVFSTLMPFPGSFASVPPVCSSDKEWRVDSTQTNKYRLSICQADGENPLTEPYVDRIIQVCVNSADCRTVPEGQDGTLNVVVGTGLTAAIDQTGNNIQVSLGLDSSINELFGTTTTVDVDNTTTETTLITGTVPANTIGTSGQVKINAFASAMNNSGGSVVFTYRLKYGSATHVCRAPSVTSSASSVGVFIEGYVQAVGTNAQRLSCTVGHGASEYRLSVPESFAITQSSGQTLSLTVQMDTANAAAEVHSYHGKAVIVR